MSWEAQKPEDGNRGEKAENRGGGDKALRRKAFQERRVIRNHQPGGKYQSQADAYVDTGADRRVAEDMEPSIAGQMRTYQHAVLGSQEDRKSTRLNSSHLGISYAVFCLKKKKSTRLIARITL